MGGCLRPLVWTAAIFKNCSFQSYVFWKIPIYYINENLILCPPLLRWCQAADLCKKPVALRKCISLSYRYNQSQLPILLDERYDPWYEGEYFVRFEGGNISWYMLYKGGGELRELKMYKLSALPIEIRVLIEKGPIY
jgi:hypothetical protein